jgi:proteasome lid subunit RPN8/RPN11
MSPREAFCEYLGDWHSHPRGSVHPSGKDLQVLREIAGHARARCKNPIMCIVAGGPSWEISAWQLIDGKSLEIEMVVVPARDKNPIGEESAERRWVGLVRNVWRCAV